MNIKKDQFPTQLDHTLNEINPDLNAKFKHSYQEVLSGKGRPADEVFSELAASRQKKNYSKHS